MVRRDWMKTLGAAVFAALCGCGSKQEEERDVDDAPHPGRFPPKPGDPPKDRKAPPPSGK